MLNLNSKRLRIKRCYDNSFIITQTTSGSADDGINTNVTPPRFSGSSQQTKGQNLAHIPGLIDVKVTNPEHLNKMYISHLLRNSNSNSYVTGEKYFPIMIRSLDFYPQGFPNSSFNQSFREQFMAPFVNVMNQNDLLTDAWKLLPYKPRVDTITNKTENYLNASSSLYIIAYILNEIDVFAKTNTLNSESNELIKDMVTTSGFKDLLRKAKLNIKNKPIPPRIIEEIKKVYGFRNLKTESGDTILYAFVPTFNYLTQTVDKSGKEVMSELVVRFPFESTVDEVSNLVEHLIDVINDDDSQKVAQNLNIIYERKWVIDSFERVSSTIPQQNVEYVTFWLNTPLVHYSDDDLIVSHSIKNIGGSISLQTPGFKIQPSGFINAFVKVDKAMKNEPKYLGGLFAPSPFFNIKCDTGNLPPFHTKVWKYGSGLSQLVLITEQIATQSRFVSKLMLDPEKVKLGELSSVPEKSLAKKNSFDTKWSVKYEQINDHLYLHKTTDVLKLIHLMREHIAYIYDVNTMNNYSMKVSGVRQP